MKENASAKPQESSFWRFMAKAIVIAILLGLFLDVYLPDFSDESNRLRVKIDNALKDERNKLYALSLVQNPAVFYKTSEIAERDGRLDNALRDIELAIGLLEMHGADNLVIKRYRDRLEKIKLAIRSRG